MIEVVIERPNEDDLIYTYKDKQEMMDRLDTLEEIDMPAGTKIHVRYV